MKTNFDLDKWDQDNRKRIAAHFLARDPKYTPDNYDWQSPISNVQEMFREKERQSVFDGKGINQWFEYLHLAVTPDDVWEFFDYPEFEAIFKKGWAGRGSNSFHTWHGFKLKHFPTSVTTSDGRAYPIWGVIDVLIFPGRFNDLCTETDPHGTPSPLMRWFALVTPRTKTLAQALEREILHSAAYTSWQRMIEALRYERQVWSDNYRPRR